MAQFWLLQFNSNLKCQFTVYHNDQYSNSVHVQIYLVIEMAHWLWGNTQQCQFTWLTHARVPFRSTHISRRAYSSIYHWKKKAKLTKTPLRARKKENFKWWRHRGCPFRSTNISRRAQSSSVDHWDTLCIASESMCPFDHQIYLDVHRIRVLSIVIHCVLPQSQSAFSHE